jgi:hypothetical protein
MEDAKIAPRSVLKPITLEMKHDFIGIVLADPESRNKRRPRLTAFDGAVLSVMVNHVNAKRGYSFIGIRAIAEKIGASPAGVAKSVNKLRDLEVLFEIKGARKNRAARWAPNWQTFLDLTVYGHGDDGSVHADGEDVGVHGITENTPSTPMSVD